jgi:2-polyprenyl-3-methyl-5-hydroxy-6-metoxy-1,4-benzoquinol methylase
MENINTCPVCGNQNFKTFLSAKDHFLTGEEFTIVQCSNCDFRFTNPRPAEKEMPIYYDSEEYISHDTKKKSFLQIIYTSIRKFTIRRKYLIAKKYAHGFSLLDIGCGTGDFLNYCRKMKFETTGIEPNNKARKFASENLSLNVYDESSLDTFLPGSFNVITMWHVLEHVHQLNDRLLKIYELLKPDGTLIIAVPDSDSWDAKKFKSYWAAYDLPRHLYHFTPDSMKNLITKNGFRIENTIPMLFDAFYISLLSEKYRSGKQNFFKAFYNGILSNFSGIKNKNNYSSLIYICKIAQESK